MKITLKSPAKINWFLLVTGKRSDGYHNIFSLMQKISLYDIISFEATGTDEIKIISNTKIPLKDNLIYRAATILKSHTSFRGGVLITLHKEIPIEAGLGGGSSNAATTLLGLNKLWNLNLSKDELISLASNLGSDVAFFISTRPAVVEGKGDKVTPLCLSIKKNFPLYILLVKPDFGVSTAMAYREIKSFSSSNKELVDKFINAFRMNRYNNLSEILINDLEEPVFRLHPELEEIKIGLLDTGALGALLSGSGSSHFAVYKEKEKAHRALESFKDRYWCKIVKPL